MKNRERRKRWVTSGLLTRTCRFDTCRSGVSVVREKLCGRKASACVGVRGCMQMQVRCRCEGLQVDADAGSIFPTCQQPWVALHDWNLWNELMLSRLGTDTSSGSNRSKKTNSSSSSVQKHLPKYFRSLFRGRMGTDPCKRHSRSESTLPHSESLYLFCLGLIIQKHSDIQTAWNWKPT